MKITSFKINEDTKIKLGSRIPNLQVYGLWIRSSRRNFEEEE